MISGLINRTDGIVFNTIGNYNVTLSVTNLFGTATLTEQQFITVTSGAISACAISSTNNNGNYGNGVTNVRLNTINNTTTTFIPANAMQDFTCSNNTVLYSGIAYDLDLTYK